MMRNTSLINLMRGYISCERNHRPWVRYYCPGACDQLVGRAHAGPGYMVRIFIREQGPAPSGKQQATSLKKVFDKDYKSWDHPI